MTPSKDIKKSENLFRKALLRKNTEGIPPIWFMRQAGRYHSHYQRLRAKHGFMELCKRPDLACEVTMGPIEEFDFDAAILFSDILFPLEVMGMPLKFDPGPQFDFKLSDRDSIQKLHAASHDASRLDFQYEALRQIRKRLSPQKGLIGFIGSPWTLFAFAVDGSHKNGIEDSIKGVGDGRYEDFIDKLLPLLTANLVAQGQSGVDAVAIFDSCAGEVEATLYREKLVPVLAKLMKDFKRACPDVSLVYYGKGIGRDHWVHLRDLPIDCLGIDWNADLKLTLEEFGDQWSIQGNIDPHWLRDDSTPVLLEKLNSKFFPLQKLSASQRQGWVCGLGHGVFPGTPEQNVHATIRYIRENFK